MSEFAFFQDDGKVFDIFLHRLGDLYHKEAISPNVGCLDIIHPHIPMYCAKG